MLKPLVPRGSFRPHEAYPPLTGEEQAIVDRFHELFYSHWQAGGETISIGWLGYETQKCALDLWIFQEIITETTPDVIIECGTYAGGSALFLASICQLLGTGQVVTIDIEPRPDRPPHPLITYLEGSSTADAIIAQVRAIVGQDRRGMVILDSNHAQAHVARELELYAPFVAVGCYLVVEDTNIHGHPAYPSYGPGPAEAVEAFLSTTSAFIVDHARERFLMTLNPSGYLRRVR